MSSQEQPSRSIPFNRPSLVGRELEYIGQAITNGQISGDGRFTARCHTLLEQLLAVPKVLLTTSCTHALEMSALLLDFGPGDEIIVPSFTFVSSVNAFVLRGARPVFVDIRADTLNLDERLIEAHITPRTKAILVVHYAGVACEMDAIVDITKRHHLALIEDNAHGLFASYQGQPLGSFGCLATQSFHETKNITCGEGGALVIRDPQYIQRAEILREKGTNRSRFFRGQVDKYTWVDVGSSYLPSELLAAFLLAQLEERESIQAKRQRIWNTYAAELGPWAAANGVQLLCVPENRKQPYHMFYMLMPDLERRQGLIRHLRGRGIQAVFHYLPLHLSEVGLRYGGQPGDLPVSERVSDQLVRLPFYNELAETDQAAVIEAVRAFDPARGAAQAA